MNPSDSATSFSPVSKTEYVLARLRKEIAAGEMAPGSPLRQSDVAQRFGVSPTPVREALRLLEAEGLIVYAAHRGATVANLPGDYVQHIYMMRARLEGLASRLAAETLEPDVLSDIQTLHERIAAIAGDGDHLSLAALNREFHSKIYASGSPLVASQIDSIWAMIPIEATLWATPELARTFAAQHGEIVRALESGDRESADALMQEHIMTAADHRQAAREA